MSNAAPRVGTGPVPDQPRRSAWEVFLVFLRLGVTSFGGPIAHLGYFRAEFVERRQWLSDREFGDLVALCQFLPGPASSQVGFGIGLLRARFTGAIAAFVAFTLPSAALLLAFAYGASLVSGPIGEGVLSGLKVVAVAIVAQAVWGMARTLTPDPIRAGIAVLALVITAVPTGPAWQLVAIALGALAGFAFCRKSPPTVSSGSTALRFPIPRGVGAACLVVFLGLLLAGPVLGSATRSGTLRLFDAFYGSGSLVFGGGHVLLPLLQASVVDPGWVDSSQFLAGYGAAQAVPGPLFSFAAYLGAISTVGPGGIAGAVVALLAVFLPGFLLLIGVLPFWSALLHHSRVQAAMRGAGAAVVGILGAALYSPIFTTAITGGASFSLAVLGFVALVAWRLPPWTVVLLGAVGGVVLRLW